MSSQPLNVAQEFIDSLKDCAKYPINLIDHHNYSATLKAYHERLEQSFENLVVQDEDEVEVPFREFDSTIRKFTGRKNMWSLEKLRTHLGIQAGFPASMTRADPKCRFVFLHGENSRAKLKITRGMLYELLTYHQVMPSYLEFLLLFGESSEPNDFRFSGFREQTTLSSGPTSLDLNGINRSGRYFELCYNLKTVDLKTPKATSDAQTWSIRQAAVYHKFDVVHGTALWIITKGSLDLRDRIEEITGKDGKPEDRRFDTVDASFRSSIAIHAMVLFWASQSWRWYLQHLDRKIETQTQHIIYGTRDKTNPGRIWYDARDIQCLQKYEDDVNAVSIAVDGNIEVMNALHQYYEALVRDSNWTVPPDYLQLVKRFSKQTQNIVSDLKMQSSRAKALARHVGERKVLVLQYVQAQTAENMEHLTKNTYCVGVSAQNEAIVMRIITVVTLIFLPATFVSTFFSTDVIKYQKGGNPGSSHDQGSTGASFSSTAIIRWLQVSLPLTALTLVFALGWYHWEKYRQKRKRSRYLLELELV